MYFSIAITFYAFDILFVFLMNSILCTVGVSFLYPSLSSAKKKKQISLVYPQKCAAAIKSLLQTAQPLANR